MRSVDPRCFIDMGGPVYFQKTNKCRFQNLFQKCRRHINLSRQFEPCLILSQMTPTEKSLEGSKRLLSFEKMFVYVRSLSFVPEKNQSQLSPTEDGEFARQFFRTCLGSSQFFRSTFQKLDIHGAKTCMKEDFVSSCMLARTSATSMILCYLRLKNISTLSSNEAALKPKSCRLSAQLLAPAPLLPCSIWWALPQRPG